MTVETDFRAVAVAHAPLVALVGQRVVQNGIDDGTEGDYIVFTTSHEPHLGIGGQVLGDQVSITAECWAATAMRANAIADALVAAMATAPPMACVTVTNRASGFDGDLGLDATVLSLEWWI